MFNFFLQCDPDNDWDDTAAEDQGNLPGSDY